MEPGIRTFGLTKWFPGGGGLERISLEVHRGGIGLISGSARSGKTTLLRILTADVRPDAGSFAIGHLPVASYPRRPPPATLRQQVVFAGRGAHPVSKWTLWEDAHRHARRLGLGAAAESRVLDRLQEVGLIGHLPQPCRQLSPPQLQRLALAKALLQEPVAILIDDADQLYAAGHYAIDGAGRSADAGQNAGAAGLLACLASRGLAVLATCQVSSHLQCGPAAHCWELDGGRLRPEPAEKLATEH